MSRPLRYITALLLVSGAFWAYQWTVAPLIEPIVAAVPAIPGNPGQQQPVGRFDLSRIDISKHFPDDAWQRNAKIVETKYGALIFGDDYRERDANDGRAKIVMRPVTLIFVADAGGGHLGERPIILHAPEGIEVITKGDGNDESKSPLALGAPIAGRLLGQVSISRTSSPQKQDGFQLVTRNVQIDEKRIATPYQVQFQVGPHFGSGSDLEILLKGQTDDDMVDAAAPALSLAGKPFPVTSLELVKLDKLVFYVDDLDKVKTTGLRQTSARKTARLPAGPPSNTPAAPGTPIEITCAGPLNLDLVRGVATMEKQVNIARIAKDGPADVISCELLEARFGIDETEPDPPRTARLPQVRPASTANTTTGANDGGAGANTTASPSHSKLKVHRLIASGYPVRLISPREKAEVRGEQLVLDMDNSMLSLVGSRGVELMQDGHQVTARRLDYRFNLDDPQRIGELWAQGPGQLSGKLGAEQSFIAQWKKVLKLTPQNEQYVISLFEGVHFAAGSTGRFQADQLYFYLNEVQRPPVGNQQPQREFLPDRLQANGNVQVHSPQMTVRTNEVQAWFQPQVGQPQKTDQKESGLKLGDPRKKTEARVDTSGRLVQLKLRYDDKMNVALDEIQVQGDVNVQREPTTSPSGKWKQGFHLTGDMLAIGGIDERQLRVHMVGRPARMNLGDGHIESGSVLLEQAVNRLEAAGVGRLSMAQKIKQPDGSFAKGPPIHVAWREGLTFDGGRVTLNGGVRVSGERPLKGQERMMFQGDAQRLDAVLARGYSFAQLDKLSEQKLEVAEVVLSGHVKFAGRTYGNGVQTSFDRLEVGEVQFNPQTHALLALGPGWLSTVRSKSKKAPAPTLERSVGAKQDDEAGLHHFRIEFEDDLKGNAKLRDLLFAERVRCVYGGVERFDEVVADGVSQERGGELTCRTLRVAEAPRGDERGVLLDANGNIHIQSLKFDAQAARLTFDQLKDLMVLHGDPRGGARLRYSPTPGRAAIPMNAQRIKFWPKTMKVDVEGFNSLTAPLGR